MRSMYSTSSGNPDLLSEAGTNWELGFALNKGLYLAGAAFLNRFKDFIDSIRLPDNTRRFFNISKAHIYGFEFQMQKSIRLLETTINYTYLDHENETDSRPLDALPSHNLNFDLNFFPLTQFRIGFFGLLASSSSWFDFSSSKILDIPSYFYLDAVLSYQWKQLELFIKATNIFDRYFYTEPIFPCKGRTLELGIRVNLLRERSTE